jgi:xylose isomerase
MKAEVQESACFQVVLNRAGSIGKTMKDHLRFAIAYWHSFCGDGTDQFGSTTHFFPWDKLELDDKISNRLDAAFEFITKIGAPIIVSTMC